MHFVIGTAGHVDHGKTALVKVLTGVDTDRWKEEKRRGITIDLGFAPLTFDDEVSASIVDVPGHEHFVRNMVAGATGIDVALLVIAADEGIMPQTREHLSILEFLGVKRGVAAVTKSDLVDDDWLELVCADTAEWLRSSSLNWSKPVAVSAETGAGLDELKGALRNGGAGTVERSASDLFRMPIDRVFSVAGAGTVVTGTVWSGRARVGEEAIVLPGRYGGRVRSVEVHGSAAKEALPGKRTAVAVSGLDREHAARGSVLVTDKCWYETKAVDVMLTLLPDARTLNQRSRVRVHFGTSEIMARVTPAAGGIAPGSSAPARLRLESPAVLRWGDRGVIRSYSPVCTIGGAVVFDPDPPMRPRRPQHAEAKCALNPGDRLAGFVASQPGGIAVGGLPIRLGFSRADAEELEENPPDGVEYLGSTFLDSRRVNQVTAVALEKLNIHHESKPLDPGMDLEEFRRALGLGPAGASLVERLRSEGDVVVEQGFVRQTGFRSSLSASQSAAREPLMAELESAGYRGLTSAELERVIANQDWREIAEFLVREGSMTRIGKDRYYSSGTLQLLIREVEEEIALRGGVASPTELKGRLGVSRKFLIPLLEWLDAKGVTVREGDYRKIGVGG